MALKGNTPEEKIWNFLMELIGNVYGVSGLMANLFKESGLNPKNLENFCERKLKEAGKPYCTDETYTAAVDSGQIGRAEFLNPLPGKQYGYGLAQWTSVGRKAGLYDLVKSKNVSIGDLETQLEFLAVELKGKYKAVLNVLKAATSIRESSDIVLIKFEAPADQSNEVKMQRAACGQIYYDKYVAKKGSDKPMGFTNSPLATCTMISPNRTPNRNHAIDTITIHCFVGQVTAKRGCEVFQPTKRGASCNYVVGLDGSIGLCVEEKDRSWCSGGSDKNGQPIRVNGISGKSNDYQAVTIEVASDNTHPYAITEKAMSALIELCADICKRNGIPKLLWQGDKKLVGNITKQNLTVHRWFDARSCPGDYIYGRLGEIADRVNAKLGASGTAASPKPVTVTAPAAVPYKVRITITDLNIRKGPSTDYGINGQIKPGAYTIISEATGAGAAKWGKLKSGAGWISLDFCKKI